VVNGLATAAGALVGSSLIGTWDKA
jgi:hypothetical protein